MDAFKLLKRDIANATLRSIDESLLFSVETDDASDYAIAATLSQQGKPVAFFSRTLNRSELKHFTIDKEAAAIIEAVQKWKHYLTGPMFFLITDQKSVSYMFNTKHSRKIKTIKLCAGKSNSALMTLILFTDVVQKAFPLMLYLD